MAATRLLRGTPPHALARLGVAALLLLASGCGIDAGFPPGYYLEGTRGPYRGRVVDAETKAPLQGAVVVATWWRDRITLIERTMALHTARETLTDANGEFTLDARDVEDNAPPRTLPPQFVIFLPGYGAFPWGHASPQGRTDTLFRGTVTTVELPKMTGAKDRRDQSTRFSPYTLSNRPFAEIPQFVRLYNEELKSFGVSPYEREQR